ncbi:WecB/TagA/CpsF family glycosyltransferase [Skermania sp. ID1734]|uniref:WecB/TagA/CpsF family glycosyltransferase n=1 Tax=Skermania sp. ID1734 TaxID=2597516 RepID=UPI00117E85FA|nr:WecB/TagA/CpsF family glycosyltransferase [Skermania sp. ID1734]TSD94465.1 WecB/TagA/CpsF family glycosyltransferase [Skermania sp. ID1734]
MISGGTPWPRLKVDGVTVDLMDRDRALELILDTPYSSGPLAVGSANLHHLHIFANRPTDPAPDLRWLTLLDGAPLVHEANKIGGEEWPKLSGSDLIHPILAAASDRGIRVGFLGSDPDTHRQLLVRLGERFPDLRVAGTWAPLRWELTDTEASARIAHEIREAEVEILVVGLGKPRQEEWISRFGVATGARVLLAFGAVIDFLAGRMQRAPKFFRDAGAEWAWRLMQEPRRLSRRYLIDCPPALLRMKRTARILEPITAAPATGWVGFVGPGSHAAVTALVVTYNNAPDVEPLIDGLRVNARDLPVRVVVVDNHSTDGTADIVRRHPDVTVVETGGNLGFAGGINVGLGFIGDCDDVLILNADLELPPGALTVLHRTAREPGVGAVVPLLLDADGAVFPSVYREPSVTRAFGDALLGSKVSRRPGFSSEFDLPRRHYLSARNIDWATGAAILIPGEVVRDVGRWNEDFFLYSEEVDYFRRIRNSGRQIRYEPAAVCRHRGGGSGSSVELRTLMAVNRIRYVEQFHASGYAALYRAIVALSLLLRCRDGSGVRMLRTVLNRRAWQDLPHAPMAEPAFGGTTARGAVIIPAHNEAPVLRRTLLPLSRAASGGYLEVIVVCNGCTDDSAEVARSVPGVRVLELAQASKPSALNAGDRAATLWPRLYLDADVEVSAAAALAVLDRLCGGEVLVASNNFRYDTHDASPLVRSYYRARTRIHRREPRTWGAGAYALSRDGHARFGEFPTVTADDLYVDTRFSADEKAVVDADPAIIRTPSDVRSLVSVLRRHRLGVMELIAQQDSSVADTGRSTAAAVLRTIRGPRSAVDATMYLLIALAARSGRPATAEWARDESSRRIAATTRILSVPEKPRRSSTTPNRRARRKAALPAGT